MRLVSVDLHVLFVVLHVLGGGAFSEFGQVVCVEHFGRSCVSDWGNSLDLELSWFVELPSLFLLESIHFLFDVKKKVFLEINY